MEYVRVFFLKIKPIKWHATKGNGLLCIQLHWTCDASTKTPFDKAHLNSRHIFSYSLLVISKKVAKYSRFHYIQTRMATMIIAPCISHWHSLCLLIPPPPSHNTQQRTHNTINCYILWISITSWGISYEALCDNGNRNNETERFEFQ